MNDCQPKCDSCVDAYNSECHCQKSVYYGMALKQIPWDGCPCFLSQRKWSVYAKPKKKLNQAPFMVKCFRLFDLVDYQKELFYVFGRRKSGYFDIRRFDGIKVNKGSINCKKLQLVETRRKLLTERR